MEVEEAERDLQSYALTDREVESPLSFWEPGDALGSRPAQNAAALRGLSPSHLQEGLVAARMASSLPAGPLGLRLRCACLLTCRYQYLVLLRAAGSRPLAAGRRCLERVKALCGPLWPGASRGVLQVRGNGAF